MRRTTKERERIQQQLGARIQRLRQREGMTQRQLAAATPIINPGTISKIERGAAAPSLETLDAIARGLGVEIKDLFDWEARDARQKSRRERLAVMRIVQLVVRRRDEEVRLAANVLRQMFNTYDKLPGRKR